MTKMSDVAKLAKVSTATVSRVLQKPDTVKEETKKKVLEAIKKLDYQPNILARNFRRLETKTILVVMPNILNNVFSEIVVGIDYEATKNGYQVILGNTMLEEQRAHGFMNHLKQKQVDGMILLTARVDIDDLVKVANEYPLVLVSDYLEESDLVTTVAINNMKDSYTITEHLINLGHKKIAHISGPLDMSICRDRLSGYQDALMDHDIHIQYDYLTKGDYSFQSGYDNTLNLLALQNPPTAIFAASDIMAMGAIKAVKSKGLQVPHDIAVVGFDDVEFSKIFEPALTTMAQPFFDMGKTAMQLLKQKIVGEQVQNQFIELKSELKTRESCGFNLK
ncbi:LacI family DNA-binding transcriptional regulator [Chengkuizengella axinellae]|uniref:LacI family DNA-binding transcriptional regulator n=1 Tax=Chengkuizengella axinellae TaxID=3064388 RepID=A0ABT9IWB2_9BACL|nr:LacI family DNA-binding transcriptional regulator [Chengkuizengella sp. 2205SS18-9]MDP5273651.1 LacI family DNA-binding transcriptional regulator [Chengkuizengella sp. 2205SS18-9]